MTVRGAAARARPCADPGVGVVASEAGPGCAGINKLMRRRESNCRGSRTAPATGGGRWRAALDTEPAKLRDGYANFAIVEPPLKLVLIAGTTDEDTRMDHLGVEVETTDAVHAAEDRSRPRAALPALCANQITSWGIVYYAFPVLNPQITAATAWSSTATTAAFSGVLLVSAAAGIPVGRILYASLAHRTGVTTRTVWLIALGGPTTAAFVMVSAPFGLLVGIGKPVPGHRRPKIRLPVDQAPLVTTSSTTNEWPRWRADEGAGQRTMTVSAECRILH